MKDDILYTGGENSLCSVGSLRMQSLILVAVCLVAMLPFLGLADFNTKGEPREALVSLSILDQSNWILPVNSGGEIPYKPPFLHWCIAAFALLFNGGVVDEYVSRLPSALALTLMTLCVFRFFAHRGGSGRALLTALVTFTAFEIYRAGMNCRVDMLLTSFSVCAILALFRWWEKGMRTFPLPAILLMSCATMTKGPVGILVPSLVVGIFMLLRGVPFFKAFLWLVLWGVLSLVLPLCWYVAAYYQGGQEFLDLVLEENFGRMTGTMAYESHVNPWYYNILTLLSGFIPWTLAAVAALFLLRRKGESSFGAGIKGVFSNFRKWIRTTPACTLLAFTAAVVIFIFYCIPASKRSVYLMPMYPFTAWFIAGMLIWMTKRKPGSVKWMGDLMSVLGILLFVAFIVIKSGFDPADLLGSGKSAQRNLMMFYSLRDAPGYYWIGAAVAPVMAILWWCRLRRRSEGVRVPLAVFMTVLAVYISLSGCYQPAVLNAKSLKPLTESVVAEYPGIEKDIYEYIAASEVATGNPLHFFEFNFYLGDKVRRFTTEKPEFGYLLIETRDTTQAFPRFRAEGYDIWEFLPASPSMPKHTPDIYRFEKGSGSSMQLIGNE